MPLSLFHIYTINGFDQCYKKKKTSKNHIYIHINQLQEGLYYWSFKFLIPGSLHQIYHASILIPWSSPHTSSNLQFILFECTYSWLLAWLAIKAWRLPMHCPIVQSKRALLEFLLIIDVYICCWNVVKCNKINISCGIIWCNLIDAEF